MQSNTKCTYKQDVQIGKAAWQHPTIKHIDIKRTLFGVGSVTDGPTDKTNT